MKQIALMTIVSIALIVLFYNINPSPQQLRESCNNFDGENGCQGDQTDNPSDWLNRNFQTPPRGSSLWKENYQDYNILQGYTQIKYSSDRNSATLNIITRLNTKYEGDLIYFFNEQEQTSATYRVAKGQGVINVKVILKKNTDTLATLLLEPVDFVWNHPTVNQPDNYKKGQKGSVVEMFGWLYEDIEQECEMLGKAGYMGVKVYPPQESILDYEHPEDGQLNPWYWLYQPVSYRLESRMGTVEQLRKLINTCRSQGVRVYADAVVNHMSGNGNDMFPNHCSGQTFWGNKNSSGGSPWYTQGFAYKNWDYTSARPGMEFPAVPYGPLDFHCARPISSWNDGFIMNYGWLVNLGDLNTETDYVRQRIADYITELLSIGFSGIRIDAAKHISPQNLAVIFKKLAENMGGNLPEDFTAYLEVILGGEKDLLMCNEGWYNYGKSFENYMKEAGLSDSDIYKIKIWSSDYPKEHPACGYWPVSSERFVIQQDCHDDQNPGSSSRDMQDYGSVLVKERNVEKHRQFNRDLFLRTDGNWQIRLIMSSYSFMDNPNSQAPPDGHSDCKKCKGSACTGCTKSVSYKKAHDPNVCGYTMQNNGAWQQGEYTRVHRDKSIIMAMRQWMGLSTSVSNSEIGLPDSCN